MSIQTPMSWRTALPIWSIALPVIGVVLVVVNVAKMGFLGSFLAGAVLIGSVIAAVHHAEVVAHRVGEPFGTLVLAIAVTVIEVSLIVSLMLSGGADASICVFTPARVHSAAMVSATLASLM